MATPIRWRVWIFPALLALAVAGCDRGAPDPNGAAGEAVPVAEPPAMRVVSLAPALTQIVVDMHQGKLLVGVAEHDAAAPAGLPVVGNFQDVNTESLIKVNPTHVLLMTGKEGPPARLVELAKSRKFDLVTYPSPLSVTDIGNIIFNEEEQAEKPAHAVLPSLGTVLEDALEAQRVKYTMLIQIGQISAATAAAHKPRVLVVIGTNPIMASGPRTVLDEVLRMVGAENAAKDAAVGAPTFDREKLLELRPEVVLLVMPSAPPLEGIDRDSRLADLRGLDIPAVQNGRIHLVNDPAAMLPSSSLARVAEAMAKAIHPELAAQITQAMTIKIAPHSPDADSHATTQPGSATKPAP